MDLPLFPLHLVLFPGRPLPLHLFEPRYLEMLDHCLNGDKRFGVVAIRSGREVGPAVIHDVGTVAEIRTVSERPDGRYDILSRGCARFRVVRPLFDRPYLRAEVELLEEVADEPTDIPAAAQLRDALIPYLMGLGVPEEYCEQLPDTPRELSYLACSALQVEVPVQQKLLELPSDAARMLAAGRIIRRESGIIKHLGLVGSYKPAGPGGAQLN